MLTVINSTDPCETYHTGCGLMVWVLVLHPKRSGSSDNSSKTHVVHVVLPIAFTWRGVDETTPETPFLFPKKKKKKIHVKPIVLKYGRTSNFLLKVWCMAGFVKYVESDISRQEG